MINETLRIAVPSKGRLAEPTITLLRAAGIPVPSDDRRLLVPIPDQNVELLFARTDDIPTLIRDGAADVGVAGSNQLLEYGSDGVHPNEAGYRVMAPLVEAGIRAALALPR